MEFLSEIIHRDKFIIENGFHTRDAIIIVLEGEFQCTLLGNSYHAKPGDIYVFHSSTPFQRKVLKPLRCVYLQFEPFPYPLPPGHLETADPTRLQNTIPHLVKAVEAEDRELTEHFILDILLLRKSREERPSAADPIVASCIRIFRQKFQTRISLDALAQQFSISKQGLIQKFRRSTGRTPMEYLSGIRLSHGKQLLRDTYGAEDTVTVKHVETDKYGKPIKDANGNEKVTYLTYNIVDLIDGLAEQYTDNPQLVEKLEEIKSVINGLEEV